MATTWERHSVRSVFFVRAQIRFLGIPHLAILAAVILTGFTLIRVVLRRPALEWPVRCVLAGAAGALGLSWYGLRFWLLHTPWRWDLPLELCDISLWTTALALVWPRQRLLELAYYWGLAGASLALLTPYLVAPVGSLLSLSFFAGHGIIVASILFLLGIGRLRPSPGSWRFALLLLNGLALVDFSIDKILGVNYMYLLHKPPIQSLFTVMGPWPWYIASAELVAALLFLAMQWPFRR